MRTPLKDRFEAKVLIAGPDDCWEWQGSRGSNGYGHIRESPDNNVPLMAHRVAWELAHGPIPDGMGVLHTCDNPPCVNVAHLWIGTGSDNMRDASAKGRMSPINQHTFQTHCKRGHPFDAENTYVNNRGHRSCRTCVLTRHLRPRRGPVG